MKKKWKNYIYIIIKKVMNKLTNLNEQIHLKDFLYYLPARFALFRMQKKIITDILNVIYIHKNEKK